MRVALLAYLLHAGRDYRAAGVSGYALQLAEALPAAARRSTVEVFHGSDAPPLRGVTVHPLPFPTSNPLLRVPWEQLAVPLLTGRGRFDLLHGTVNVVPVRSRAVKVVTVHDLSFLRHPERFRRSRVAYLTVAMRASAQVADRIICVSEHTRRDVIELLGVSGERVVVIPPGVASRFRPLARAEVEEFARRVLSGAPYILHVGTLEPRKNIDVLIAAFARLRRRRGFPHSLALVGARGWLYHGLYALVQRLDVEDAVRFVDYVSPEELPLWYNAAAVLAVPSAYEGFGFPVVEAMACGTPVITSDTSSLAEIAGEVSVVAGPGSVEELERALERVLDDAELRGRLIAAGLERAATFSWSRAAEATWKTYRRTLEERA